MNTKMNMEIYTGSGHQSIILYVQCGWVSTLLILVSSIEELVMGGLQVWECCERKPLFWSPECSYGWESYLGWLEMPFIGKWGGVRPIAGSIRVPAQDPGTISTPCLVFSVSSQGVYLEIFFTTYPHMMSIVGTSYHWLGDQHLGFAWQTLHWSVIMPHDVIDWSCLTVAHWPTTTMGHHQ
jgi:hypothetical protein